jgi:hypothetical protein
VVVATGLNATPVVPPWPGADGFTGTLLHSAGYRAPDGWAGREALVVGGGNSGLDIAADLAAGGARPVRLAIRTPPHIVKRELLGCRTTSGAWPCGRCRRAPWTPSRPPSAAPTLPDWSASGSRRRGPGSGRPSRAGGSPPSTPATGSPGSAPGRSRSSAR